MALGRAACTVALTMVAATPLVMAINTRIEGMVMVMAMGRRRWPRSSRHGGVLRRLRLRL